MLSWGIPNIRRVVLSSSSRVILPGLLTLEDKSSNQGSDYPLTWRHILQQGWETSLRARAEILYRFRKKSFHVLMGTLKNKIRSWGLPQNYY
jgi:hypothetical protein